LIQSLVFKNQSKILFFLVLPQTQINAELWRMLTEWKYPVVDSSEFKSVPTKPCKHSYTGCSESRIAPYLLSANLGLPSKSVINFHWKIIIILNSKKTHFPLYVFSSLKRHNTVQRSANRINPLSRLVLKEANFLKINK